MPLELPAFAWMLPCGFARSNDTVLCVIRIEEDDMGFTVVDPKYGMVMNGHGYILWRNYSLVARVIGDTNEIADLGNALGRPSDSFRDGSQFLPFDLAAKCHFATHNHDRDCI